MNKIYWDRDKISILTNQIEAVPHKHWAMQLFLNVEKNLEINIEGQQISCKCIVINHNTLHSFSTGNRLHFTLIMEPAACFARQFDEILKGKNCHVFDNPEIDKAQSLLLRLIENGGMKEYHDFMIQLYKALGLKEQAKLYDERIQDLLSEIEQGNCDTYSIASFADKAALSPSRLSHLFKEQTGIPLKCYLQFHQMKRAFLALSNGKNITEASMTANFDTPSHFAAVTKRMMGMPAGISLKDSVFLKVTGEEIIYH